MVHVPHMPHLKSIGKPLKRLKVGRAFKKSFNEFLNKTAIHAYRWMVEPNRHIVERSMWMVVNLTMIVVSIYIVVFAWNRFTENPTITTLESQHYSIYDLNFPAVGVCSNNKISRAYAENYADRLLNASKPLPLLYRSKDRLVELIRGLGRLYDWDLDNVDIEQLAIFQEVLDQVDSNIASGVFDANDKLSMLAPKCDDIFVKCKWGGVFVNCSEIIDYRATSEGFCCTFNYVRPAWIGQKQKPPRKPVGIGDKMGISILLNLTHEDYFYPLKNFIGATAMIFDPDEYADDLSGNLRSVLVKPFQEIQITVNMNTRIAVEEVQRYSVAKRGCMFPNDLIDEYQGKYTYGDCLVKCKLKSVIALCKCKLYNLPSDFPDVASEHLPYCSLANINCLNKYRVKWQTYRPREMIAGLERDMEDSLSCENCYPLCSTSSYMVDSTTTQLNFNYINKNSMIDDVNESQDLSVLKVYFPHADSVLYSTNVLYAWYDILSEYGGILSLCLGCSILSFIELLYFLTARFYQNLFSKGFLENFKPKPKSNIFDAARNFQVRSRFDYIN